LFATLSPLAQTGGGGGGSTASLLIFIVLMGLVFYVFLIRPQRRRQRQHADLISRVRVGHEVQMAGGILGRVRRVDDEEGTVSVEVAPGVEVRFLKGAISRNLTLEQQGDEAAEEAGEQP
jgi:preprotein translocase subunit YajC